MKKIICSILSLAMAISLVACGDVSGQNVEKQADVTEAKSSGNKEEAAATEKTSGHKAETRKKEASDDKKISSPVIRKDKFVEWDTIYFGSYYQEDKEKEEPLCWRVLQVEEDKKSGEKSLFLMCEKLLDKRDFHNSYEPVTWEKSATRKWLNTKFLKKAFSKEEQEAILTTKVVNNDTPKIMEKGGKNTEDKIYLLSVKEVSNKDYGFSDKFKEVSNTRNAWVSECTWDSGGEDFEPYEDTWWLRSPGVKTSFKYLYTQAVVYPGGNIGPIGERITDENPQARIRPVLHLKMNATTKKLWKKGKKILASLYTRPYTDTDTFRFNEIIGDVHPEPDKVGDLRREGKY